MLFRALESYLLGYATARSLPHLSAYIDTLTVRRAIITDRYTNAVGYESNLVVLLRKILADADIPSLLRKESDLACYLDDLIDTTQDLNSIFDAVTTGLSFTNMAIQRNPAHTEEFFIPVQCQDPTRTLPFDAGWEAWQTVKPIRMVDVDSLELTFQTYQDQIVFTTNYPSRAVFTIDVVALVLQYVNFLRVNPPIIDEPEYIHRYVLIFLFQDLQDLWLGNIYDAVIKKPTQRGSYTKLDLNGLLGEQYYGYVGSELPAALRDLQSLVEACRNGAVTPATLVKSLRLSSGDLPSFLQTLLATTSTNQRRQNQWCEYLRDMRWLSILYDAYQLQPDFIATRNLHTALKRDVPLAINTQFWKHCHSAKTRHFIEHDIHERLLTMT
jgi:hypothetical protein